MALLAEVGGQIDLALGDRIYSRNADPLEAVVGRKLTEQRASLAVAESATGGGLAERISSVPGSSAYFLGGFVTYTKQMKTNLLGVPEDLLKEFGAVSHETAEAMAIGARRRTAATWAISVTGNAGPTTDGDEATVGTVYIGIAGPRDTTVYHRVWPASDRPRVRAFAAQMALDMLNRKLGV
jgi:nicotinamide-nucleotide amidase